MRTRRALCFVLAALCALQPALPALADGAAPTLAPAQIDQLMAERYGPLSYRPEPACADPLCAQSADATIALMAAASGGGDDGSSTQVWVIVAVVVVLALVLGGGGGGSSY